MKNITLVEDEPIIRASLERLLTKNGYHISAFGSVAAAVDAHALETDLIITDVRLPGEEGTVILDKTQTPVLVMTSYASLNAAVEIMRKGAVDYIAKPFNNKDMLTAISRALSHTTTEQHPTAQKGSTPAHTTPQDNATTGVNIIGQSRQMKQVFTLIDKVAPTDTTVLILGDSGTGKELVAKSLHHKSPRHSRALIPVNCATFPESLIESELFGYVKGAFTGADKDHIGLVESADGGTLFLDEIGELPLTVQARLLRLLQEKEIRQVGSTESRVIDVRLIAATHQNLQQLVADGKFREDLYYRLNVFDISLPPLRERGGDIMLIANFLLQGFSDKSPDAPCYYFDESAAQALVNYTWPGNIRELENVIEKAVILTDSHGISARHLTLNNKALTATPDTSTVVSTSANNVSNYDNIPDGVSAKDHFFIEFLKKHQLHMSETELAKKMGISRKTLWQRRKKLNFLRKKSSS